MSRDHSDRGGSPEIRGVERKVFETALKIGVPPHAEIRSVNTAKYYLDIGARHLALEAMLTCCIAGGGSTAKSYRKRLTVE